MASESSSAVLELNDADEETEAPSARDDGEGSPLIMEPGMDIAVKVDAPLKQLSTLETFVTYRVRCVCARWPTPSSVRRRYNHFKALHKRLCAAHAWCCVPPPPPLHSARQQLDRYSPSFVAVRTLALHAFLDRIARHPILTHSEDFRIFLTTPDDELEKVFRSEGSALSLWGLGSLYGTSEKPNNGVRVKDPEFAAAADYLQSLQQKLTTLCSLTTKLYQGSASLSTELVGMKRACDAWCCGTVGAVSRAVGGASLGAHVAGGALMKRACDAWCCGTVGAVSRAVGGASLGAHVAGGALARLRPPHSAQATLPLLAAYAGVLNEKIRQRDALHAAHISDSASGVAGVNEAHNRLSVAVETLRSEIDDWTPKTRTDVKRELMQLAKSRVTALTQVLQGWESALKLSTEANMEEVFKTVSRTAVQNLSPERHTPCETDKDFDDFANYSDSDIQETNTPQHARVRDGTTQEDYRRERDSDIQDDSEVCKSEVMSDPLQSFSDVDLSS